MDSKHFAVFVEGCFGTNSIESIKFNESVKVTAGKPSLVAEGEWLFPIKAYDTLLFEMRIFADEASHYGLSLTEDTVIKDDTDNPDNLLSKIMQDLNSSGLEGESPDMTDTFRRLMSPGGNDRPNIDAYKLSYGDTPAERRIKTPNHKRKQEKNSRRANRGRR